MRPRLPRKVHVGPLRYRVVASSDGLSVLHDAQAVGLTSPDEATIWISSEIAEKRAPSIVLHELIHACADMVGLGDANTEEDWATCLAPILLDTLRRNPELVTYLLKGE